MNIEDKNIQRQLYDKIMTVMKEQKPYLHADFDVNTLASIVHSNRSYISHTINVVCGTNFYAWLANYRNDIALHAIRNNPNLKVLDLCAITGLSSKEVFCRQFKKLNGMTLTEYKEKLG